MSYPRGGIVRGEISRVHQGELSHGGKCPTIILTIPGVGVLS